MQDVRFRARDVLKGRGDPGSVTVFSQVETSRSRGIMRGQSAEAREHSNCADHKFRSAGLGCGPERIHC